MLLAIERSRFNYLYKLNELTIDINGLIDLTIEEAEQKLRNDFNELVDDFHRALPAFEEDHEVILLNIEKSKLKIQGRVTVAFQSVLSIYPLTNNGSKLLAGKLNDKFRINPPLFESVVQKVKEIRSIESRRIAVTRFLSYFSLPFPRDKEVVMQIRNSVTALLNKRSGSHNGSSYFDHLLSYNITPSYMPSGNVEFLCKIGAVAMKFLGRQEDAFANGPFYKSCLSYKSEINLGDYEKSFETFLSLNDNALRTSHEKIVEIISKDFPRLNIFKISYFFLAFKSYLNKNDLDFLGLKDDIEKLKRNDADVAAWVLTLLGYVFSFDQLYEGLHIMNNAPLFITSLKPSEEYDRKEKELLKKENEKEKTEIIKKEEENSLGMREAKKSDSSLIKELDSDEKEVVYEKNLIEEPLPTETDSDRKAKSEETMDTTSYQDIKVEKLKKNISISDLKTFITVNFEKVKKPWSQFIETYLIDKYTSITYNDLITAIDHIPDLKGKLLKSKKAEIALKNFFDAAP
jgi:hypothetical protein